LIERYSSRSSPPSAVCGVIRVVAEFMVRMSAVCGVIRVVAEFMVRMSAVCGVIRVVAELMVRMSARHSSRSSPPSVLLRIILRLWQKWIAHVQ
jgi:hypothetical protein